MKPDATRFFVCPHCRGELSLTPSKTDNDGEIIEGSLGCAKCNTTFRITRGVPRFVEGEEYADTFGRQWTRWSQTQHDSHNGTSIFRGRLQRYTSWSPESMTGKVVIEAGCGPGGFIDVIEKHAAVMIGFDLSVAIDAAYALHGRRPNVYLAQGDIFNPPIRERCADRLYTFGVVQHTPDPEKAFRSLIPLVKSGGEIAVWVYRKWPIPQPVYWMRYLTRGMPEPRATKFIEWYTPRAMWLSGTLGEVPKLGRWLRRLIPVADYRDRKDERQQLDAAGFREWALMDTHDMLITRHTYPQRWSDIQRWMRDLENVRRTNPPEMAAVAVKPR